MFQIKQIFSQDKQLAAELLFDLKALEERERLLQQQLAANKLRDKRGSESSEPDYESNSTTPVASPGRPVVPAEVRPVMAALTPQVRANVEPLLAKVSDLFLVTSAHLSALHVNYTACLR